MARILLCGEVTPERHNSLMRVECFDCRTNKGLSNTTPIHNKSTSLSLLIEVSVVGKVFQLKHCPMLRVLAGRSSWGGTFKSTQNNLSIQEEYAEEKELNDIAVLAPQVNGGNRTRKW